jgi:hypothetical protein
VVVDSCGTHSAGKLETLMKLVHNKAEFEKAYYYKDGKIAKKDYPKRYPCVVVYEYCEGGLGGDYVVHHLHYPGKLDVKAFMAGLRAAGVD